jgi:hypothetical protein
MDTLLSTHDLLFAFKHQRRHSEGGMYPLSVIVLLNILEKFCFRMVSIVKDCFGKPFGFQCSEKRFSDCIVPTISFPAHALDKFMLFQHLPKSPATELNPSVGMDHCPCCQSTPPYSPIEGLQDPFVAQRSAYVPSRPPCGKKGQ